jgi:hypothetical protein
VPWIPGSRFARPGMTITALISMDCRVKPGNDETDWMLYAT